MSIATDGYGLDSSTRPNVPTSGYGFGDPLGAVSVPGLGAYSGLSAHEALCRRIEFDGGVRPSSSETPELVRLVTGGVDAQETLSVLQAAGATSGEIVGAAIELISMTIDTERENALILFAELFEP